MLYMLQLSLISYSLATYKHKNNQQNHKYDLQCELVKFFNL